MQSHLVIAGLWTLCVVYRDII